MIVVAALGSSNTMSTSITAVPQQFFRTAMVSVKTHGVLGRCHQLQVFLIRVLQKIGDLIIAEMVMVRKGALQHDFATKPLDSSKTWRDRRYQHRPARAFP